MTGIFSSFLLKKKKEEKRKKEKKIHVIVRGDVDKTRQRVLVDDLISQV